jgi:hypothetical protein
MKEEYYFLIFAYVKSLPRIVESVMEYTFAFSEEAGLMAGVGNVTQIHPPP